MQNIEGIEAKYGTIDAKYEVQIQNMEDGIIWQVYNVELNMERMRIWKV
jgi:hypothetical protein